jgi:predicted metal-dependent phosphoesterase TrpH
MTYRVDLHVHSKYSGDTDSEPEEAVIHAIGLNLHGIAFTEHYSYEASEPVERLKEKYRDKIMIFRGVEFSTLEGHCLIFGVNTDNMSIRYAPVVEIVRRVNEDGGIVIPSHPFRGGNSLGDAIRSVKGFRAIEGYNGYSHHSQNSKAVSVAGELALPYTGGSDAHEPREVGACFTEFFDAVSHDNFIDLLRAGNYRGVDTRKVSRVWPF